MPDMEVFEQRWERGQVLCTTLPGPQLQLHLTATHPAPLPPVL
jgi:hypothetical protein